MENRTGFFTAFALVMSPLMYMFNRLDSRMDRLEDKMDRGFENLDMRMDLLEKRAAIDSMRFVMIENNLREIHERVYGSRALELDTDWNNKSWYKPNHHH